MELNAERFESAGDGAPLLIAHGLLGQARNWSSLAKRLAAKRPVATVDMRNHGDSPWDETMDYQVMGRDLLAAAERLFDRPAVLVGHSMGGKAAMSAALQAPERIGALLVADIAPVAYTGHDHGYLVAAMQAADLKGAERRADVEKQLAEAAPDLSMRAFLIQNLAFEERDGARIARWKPNLAVLGRAMPDLLGWPAALEDASYHGSTLFLHGGASPYLAAEAHEPIRRLFPKAEIETIDGAGHWLHAEKPGPFIAAVEAWLARAAA